MNRSLRRSLGERSRPKTADQATYDALTEHAPYALEAFRRLEKSLALPPPDDYGYTIVLKHPYDRPDWHRAILDAVKAYHVNPEPTLVKTLPEQSQLTVTVYFRGGQRDIAEIETARALVFRYAERAMEQANARRATGGIPAAPPWAP